MFATRFTGFGPETFAAFEPRKWSSNLYNLERMAVRDQLRALGAALEGPPLADRPLAREVTPHTPSVFNGRRVQELVLYFTRAEAEKKAVLPLLDSRLSLPEQLSDAAEHHRHVTLGVRVARDGVEVGLMLHSTAWLDVMNLLNRCRNPVDRSRFVALVRGLPAGSLSRVAPERMIPSPEFDAVHIEELEEAVLNETFLIFFGRRFDAESSVLRSEAFIAPCREVLAATLALYEFIAWRPASDYLTGSPFTAAADQGGCKRVAEEPEVADLSVGARVRVTEGPFVDRRGVITELDHKGVVKVLIGKVTIRTHGRCVRPVAG